MLLSNVCHRITVSVNVEHMSNYIEGECSLYKVNVHVCQVKIKGLKGLKSFNVCFMLRSRLFRRYGKIKKSLLQINRCKIKACSRHLRSL